MRKLFRSHNIQAKIPVFEGDAATMRQANEELLKRCDAVVIFYGEGGAAWKVSNELEVTKMRGGLPPVPVWIYLTGPQTEDKQDIMDLEEPFVLNCLQGFSETAITRLVEAMEGRKA